MLTHPSPDKITILFVVEMVRMFKIYFLSNFQAYNVVDFPGGLVVKNPVANAGDPGDVGSIPGSGRSSEGNGNPFQYSWLENPMDRGAWWATVHRETESDLGTD